MFGVEIEEGELVTERVREGIRLLRVLQQERERDGLCAVQRVVRAGKAYIHIGRPIAKAQFSESLPHAAGGVIAPALLVEQIARDEVADTVGVSTELAFDGAASEGAAVGLCSETGKVEAVFGLHRKRAAQGVEAEDGIRAGDQRDVGNRRFRQKIPVDGVAEWLVDAHTVLEHGYSGGGAEHRRSAEAAEVDVRLVRVALGLIDVDTVQRAVEEAGQAGRRLA